MSRVSALDHFKSSANSDDVPPVSGSAPRVCRVRAVAPWSPRGKAHHRAGAGVGVLSRGGAKALL